MKILEYFKTLLEGRGWYAAFMVISALVYTCILILYFAMQLLLLILGVKINNKADGKKE
ncbi:hypothetical protein IAI10_09060 [Clostridium sp. 19966]|uniref:hypothetical protein n=1 Tax=Clostridium sp. 19966 TaxID=2768166 RepID=UPI0028DDFDFF|nr:hypothetical protein [Clostridium sp. 19966]MDT8716806.1 hypothetical protein [Clostridium sp. 19966]